MGTLKLGDVRYRCRIAEGITENFGHLMQVSICSDGKKLWIEPTHKRCPAEQDISRFGNGRRLGEQL